MDLAAENKELREKLESRTRDSEELNIELLCLEGRNKELREKLRIEEEIISIYKKATSYYKEILEERLSAGAYMRSCQNRITELEKELGDL